MPRFCFIIISALEKNDVNAAEEEYRFLVTHYINASTQWATSLRQIIHSIPGIKILSANESDPFVLQSHEVNSVQFIDVSTETASPFPPQVPIIPASAPALPFNHAIENVASNEENSHQSNESNSSKSKTSRFGRILHL